MSGWPHEPSSGEVRLQGDSSRMGETFNPNGTSGGGGSPFATTGVSPDTPDPEPLIRNIWTYIFNYVDQKPPLYHPKPVLQILRAAHALLEAEASVVELSGTVCFLGGIHGHADSLAALLCHTGMPPATTYVFMGNLAGQGFAPHECLLLLLAFKVRFPHRIFLLKGGFEEPEVLKGMGFLAGLKQRGLLDDVLVWAHLERVLQAMPLAVLLDQQYLALPGGPGPALQRLGVRGLRAVPRPPRLPEHVAATQECQWACLRLPGDEERDTDGSPTFLEEDVVRFCADNGLRLILRSRQMVLEGVLNLPAQMLTVWSAVTFLDSFRNHAAAIRLNGTSHKAEIVRYRTREVEPQSLDENKPPAGRNAIQL